MVDMMRVALEGSEDDLSAFEQADAEDVAAFVHPVSGLTYRALKVGETPVGYDMVQRKLAQRTLPEARGMRER